MKRPLIFALFLLIVLLNACTQKADFAESAGDIPPEPAGIKIDYSDQENETEVHNPAERKIIKSGEITFETDDMGTTAQQIDQAVKATDAYIAKDNENKYEQRVSRNLTIRVPAENFDELLEAILKGIDHVEEKSIELKDVTEEFVDNEARLKSKRELEQRYLELLDQATSVKDMLAIEDEIGKLREEIESVEGRLKYLKDRVAYSTLQVSYYKTKQQSKSLDFAGKLGDGLAQGWNNMLYFIIGLAYIWPFLLIFLLFIVGIVWVVKSKKRKTKTTA